jgi:CTP:molybdopterin cytidylyltransferase MocA
MILALLLADKPDSGRYFAPSGEGCVIERVAATVLRGPFGGTLVAARAEIAPKAKEALRGFALQHVDTSQAPGGTHGILIAALNAAEEFRSRWEKARAAAAERFEKTAPGKNGGSDWGKHKQSADVKIRGLARSFDRDGVLVIPADSVDLKPEHLARVVEAFARDGQESKPHAFAQVVYSGQRSWPVAMSLEGAREVAGLSAKTEFSEWLLKNVERVKDVPC